MKFECLKLDSVGENTVGGSSAGAISVIYSYLLTKHKLNWYKFILINHVNSDDLNETIVSLGNKKIGINIKYQIVGLYKNFSDNKKIALQNDIIYSALKKIGETTKKMDFEILLQIKKEVEYYEYNFVIPLIKYKIKSLFVFNVTLNLIPCVQSFEYFIHFNTPNSSKINVVHLFSGVTTLHYVDDFFNRAIVEGADLIVSGNAGEIAFKIITNTGELELFNLNTNSRPEMFELMKA